VQPAERGADGETAETHLGDGCVDNPLVAKAVQQALGDLVCAVVLGNLLTHDEHLGVALELLGERLVQGVADCVLLDTGGIGICPFL
jgi:hypothetical protein